MAELLLELLSEEIPARMQSRAAADLKRLITDQLATAGLSYDNARSFVTPRRLALVIDGLPDKQPDVTEEKKGPKKGAPEQALAGFMKANGLASLEEAELRETGKGSFYFHIRQVPGRQTAEVLPGLLAEAISAMPWPKSMRWAAIRSRWVRPLHSVVAVLDGKVLDGQVDLQGDCLTCGNESRGHRFLAPDVFEVTSFADYADRLRSAKVLLDPAERKEAVSQEAEALVSAAGLTIKADQGLLDEVTGLVEWPVVLMGKIDDVFMDLPPEVLSTSMRAHQKYFSTLDSEGKLANRFVFVANMETADEGRAIVEGNERVLRARLSDARFFWDQDRKASLASRVPALDKVVFHAKLGTLAEKVSRMQSLAVELVPHLPGADIDRARSAARLAKADLTSGMVGEFPELQGVIGRYYAQFEGEHEDVATAIAEHYAPQGPADRCPSEPTSIVTALADKLDTLVGFWAIDEKPTGSKDPYALRRAALGVIRLIIENKVRLPLEQIAGQALSGYGPIAENCDREEVVKSLMAFFADRLKVVLKDQGVRHDLISAVFALGGEDDLVRLLARVEALRGFLESEDGANILVAYRRAVNIVRIETKKDKTEYDGAVDPDLMVQGEEKALAEALEQANAAASKALAEEDFAGTMAALAALRQPVDTFFDEVTVNAKDAELRDNRLRLLSSIGATLEQVADFSKIEG